MEEEHRWRSIAEDKSSLRLHTGCLCSRNHTNGTEQPSQHKTVHHQTLFAPARTPQGLAEMASTGNVRRRRGGAEGLVKTASSAKP